MNKQRESVYALRREILEGQIRIDEEEALDTRGYLMGLAEDLLDDVVERHIGRETDVEAWDVPAFKQEVTRLFGFAQEDFGGIDFTASNSDEIGDAVWERVKDDYDGKEALVGRDLLAPIERNLMLQVVDGQWKDHLYSLDHLKEGIGLRGYGQRDPLVEYKKESYTLFAAMKQRVDEEMVRYLWRLRPMFGRSEPQLGGPQMIESVDVVAAPSTPRQAPAAPVVQKAVPEIFSQPKRLQENRPAPAAAGTASGIFGAPTATATPPRSARVGGDDAHRTVRRDVPKVGRNDDCP